MLPLSYTCYCSHGYLALPPDLLQVSGINLGSHLWVVCYRLRGFTPQAYQAEVHLDDRSISQRCQTIPYDAKYPRKHACPFCFSPPTVCSTSTPYSSTWAASTIDARLRHPRSANITGNMGVMTEEVPMNWKGYRKFHWPCE